MQTSVPINYPASVRRKVHHRQRCRSFASASTNRSSAWLDNVFSHCPDVFEYAVMGVVPDGKHGEAINVPVVHEDPAFNGTAVLGCRNEQLAAYKRPQHIQVHDALPKTAVGKIRRHELQVGSH